MSTESIAHLSGKEFELVVKERLDILRKAKQASIGRYGVQASVSVKGGQREVILMRSLPDFEGVAHGAKQVIFDTKVCSQASWALNKFAENKGPSRRQLEHMLERSEYGVVCFFLVHWNPRELKTKSESSETFAVPVHYSHPLWVEFFAGERKGVNRSECATHGVYVPWVCRGAEKKPRPDVMFAIRAVGGVLFKLGKA